MNPLQGIKEIENSYATTTIINALRAINLINLLVK